MSGHESNRWGRGLAAGTPAVEAVSQVAVHVQEDTKSDVLIDFTDSHVVDFEDFGPPYRATPRPLRGSPGVAHGAARARLVRA